MPEKYTEVDRYVSADGKPVWTRYAYRRVTTRPLRNGGCIVLRSTIVRWTSPAPRPATYISIPITAFVFVPRR